MHVHEYPSVKRRIETAAELAANAFKDHVVTVEQASGVFRCWHCGRPDGSPTYHFRVATFPGSLLVAGDIGETWLQRSHDMIAWARRSIDSLGYFAGKACREVEVTEYEPDVVMDWAAAQKVSLLEEMAHWPDDTDMAAECRDRIDALADVRGWTAEEGEAAIMERLADAGLIDRSDPPSLRCYTQSFLWCREALKWLLARVPDGKKEATDGGK